MNPEEAADKEIERAQSEPFDPPYQANKMRIEGHEWAFIAQSCGYKNAMSAAIAAKNYLQSAAVKQSNERKSEIVALEESRYDALQTAWWYAATHGDEKAANIVLKIMAQRSKLMGLEVLETDKSTKSNTILVMGDSSQYAEKLQEIVEGKYHVEEEDD